jgi:transcriptional regulator with XRE-family HTH domain
MQDGKYQLYPRIEPKLTDTSQHSRLYHLAPIEVGTPYVESITGYISRLAIAHNVSSAALFKKEIAPAIGKAYLSKSYQSGGETNVLSHQSYPIAANGLGIVAKDWVRALETLTRYSGLQFLTLLTWEHMISDYKLLRPTRAWCPACYEMWYASGQPVYEPLMWALRVVTLCMYHKSRLRLNCPACNRQPRIISDRFEPGHCDRCRTWLGISHDSKLTGGEDISEQEISWQSWVYNAMSDLFISAPLLSTIPKKDIVPRVVSSYLEHSTSSIKSVAVQIGISRPTLSRWARGACRPSLGPLLMFCRLTDTSPALLATAKFVKQGSQNETTKSMGTVERRKVRFNYERTRSELQMILKEFPPPSRQEVLRRVKCCETSLVTHFPDSYKEALNNYQEYKKTYISDAENKMLQVLQDALNEDPPPSMAELVNRSKYMSETQARRKFPALCKSISARYGTRPAQSLANLQKILEQALYEYPPAPVVEIARRMKCNKGRLYLNYPDLCYGIAARYSEYEAQRRLKREEKFRQEVRQVAIGLSNRGIYPSVRSVAMSLPNSKNLMFSTVLQDELRKVRVELCIQEKSVNCKK